jgi:hypothetical protein
MSSDDRVKQVGGIHHYWAPLAAELMGLQESVFSRGLHFVLDDDDSTALGKSTRTHGSCLNWGEKPPKEVVVGTLFLSADINLEQNIRLHQMCWQAWLSFQRAP